jgi:hypothetical protein
MGRWSDHGKNTGPGGDACRSEGIAAAPAKRVEVRFPGIDISSELQLHSLHAGHAAACCAECRRRLLPGELLHVYESGRSLCTLCAQPETRPPLRYERIHAAVTRLAVVPRAA